MSSESPIDVYMTRVAKVWPWLDQKAEFIDPVIIDSFYSFTYTYGTDDWGLRLEEGADNDESQRCLYAFKLCLEFNFNGKGVYPSLSIFWRDLHRFVVCPLFKKAMSEDLHERYISWPTKIYKLDRNKVQKIWDSVYKNDDCSLEDEWVAKRFHMFIMQDHKSIIDYNKSITITVKRDLEDKKQVPKIIKPAEDVKPVSPVKLPENSKLTAPVKLARVVDSTSIVVAAKPVPNTKRSISFKPALKPSPPLPPPKEESEDESDQDESDQEESEDDSEQSEDEESGDE